MIIEIILIYIVYLILVVIGSYYVNLYITKEQFDKGDLKNILPYLSQLWQRISMEYSSMPLMLILGSSSLVGAVLTLLTGHWLLNSSIIFLLLYFIYPLVKKKMELTGVTTGGGFADTALNIFMRYYGILVIGFGTGTATGLMYNWEVYKVVHFLWFIVNFIVLTVFIGIAIKNLYQHQ